ncbi:MAG: tRNA lysidine(34) synthetase TilS [Tepidisphaeraceae bacterium]|jgi:tRNA(Ile)-lysidine synthase
MELRPIPSSGAWAVGVSGGSDSVALLLLMSRRADLSLHVVHLDHQIRGKASTEDAQFVKSLADALGLPCTIARRDQLEAEMRQLPANPSARYRALRMELFARVVRTENLQGVALGHHADDLAETILLRLLRGKGPAGPGGVAGMSAVSRVRGITVIRPLLHAGREELRDYLCAIGQTWREDQSNQSDRYQRNRIRRWLNSRRDLRDSILDLGRACGKYAEWVRESSPELGERFWCRSLSRLPGMLGRESARRWLIARGSPAEELGPVATDRLRLMAVDAATAARQQFPGGLSVRRAGGRIGLV